MTNGLDLGGVAIDFDATGRDHVLERREHRHRFFEIGDGFLAATDRTAEDGVIDDGIFGEDVAEIVEIAMINGVALADEQVLNLHAVGNLFDAQRHNGPPW